MDLKKGYVARMDQLADSSYPVINTTIASVAVSALMKDTPTQFSTPKHPCLPTNEPQPSMNMATWSQHCSKKLKLGLS